MKRCGKCGNKFEGDGDYCSGCTNGHGSNRQTIDEQIKEDLDRLFPDDEEEDE